MKRNWYLVRVIIFGNNDRRRPIRSNVMSCHMERIPKELELQVFNVNGVDLISDWWFRSLEDANSFLAKTASI